MANNVYYTISAKYARENNLVTKEEKQEYVWNPETGCDELTWEEDIYISLDGVKFNQWFRWLDDTGIEMEEVFIHCCNEPGLFREYDFVKETHDY